MTDNQDRLSEKPSIESLVKYLRGEAESEQRAKARFIKQFGNTGGAHHVKRARKLRQAADALTALAQSRTKSPEGEAVAWRVKDFADGWVYYVDSRKAHIAAIKQGGAQLQALYASPPSPGDGRLREAAQKALEFAVMTLAFIGRDQGTDRIDITLDGLCKLAKDLDAQCRAALSDTAPQPLPVIDREEWARIIDQPAWQAADELISVGTWTLERALSSGRCKPSLAKADLLIASLQGRG